MKLRKWQNDALKVIKRTVKSNDKTIIPVNACVGSGKTFVAESAFGEFIKLHHNEKTVQLFVTPRIRLCDQQAESIKKTLTTSFKLNDNDYKIEQVDCTKKDYNWRSSKLYAKHVIFVICSESLFGLDPAINNAKVSRFTGWLRNFKEWQKQGYMLGFAAFDEAHNYENSKDYIINTEESVDNFFKVMLLSGTPSAFQKDLTNLHHRNVCDCEPKVAIENGWIVKPTLNIVKGCAETTWARAIVAVLNKEIEICSNEVFKPRIMINCSGIDEIKKLRDLAYFKENAGKKFHFISLHSIKQYTNENNESDEIKPMIDNEEVDGLMAYGKDEEDDKHTAYGKIRRIDSDTAFDDDLPIIVAQVQMLGEGINVSSFNACLTSTNSEKTVMQQVGRIIRNYKYKGKEKVKNGHANVYAMYDNENTLINLFKNLNEYKLTDNCFQWGDKIDVSTSAGTSVDNNEAISLNMNFHWEEIDPNNDIEIVAAQNAAYVDTVKRIPKEIIYRILSGRDLDGNGIPDKFEFDEVIKILCENGYVKQYSKIKINANNITEEIREDVLNGMLLKLRNNLKKNQKTLAHVFITHTDSALTIVFNNDKKVAKIMAKLLTDEEKDWLAVEKGWLKNENIR